MEVRIKEKLLYDVKNRVVVWVKTSHWEDEVKKLEEQVFRLADYELRPSEALQAIREHYPSATFIPMF